MQCNVALYKCVYSQIHRAIQQKYQQNRDWYFLRRKNHWIWQTSICCTNYNFTNIETLEYFLPKRQWYWNTWIFPRKKAMILKHLNISQKRQWYRDLRTALVLTNEVLAAARAQKKFVFGHQSGQLFHKPQFQNGFDKCISYIYSVEFFVEFFSKKSYEDFTIIRGQWWRWWCRWSPVETAVMRKVSQSATFTTGETNIASAAGTIVNMGMKKTPFCGCFYL